MEKYRYEIIKQQVDGLKHIATYIKLKKVGQVYRGLCPFHGEKTPSLTVYPKGYTVNGKAQDYTSFYCFGCGVAGDIINFKQLKDNLTREEACEELEKEYGFKGDDEDAQRTYLEEQLNIIKNSYGNILSLSEVNLICSSICRNYLSWVKEYYPQKHEIEIKFIDKVYKYFDKTLLERTAIESMSLIDEVNEKIKKRRLTLKEGLINEK